MSTLKYLPVKSEYCDKIAKILDGYEQDLYLVGSAARKYLYNLKGITPEDYNFILASRKDSDFFHLIDEFNSAFPGKVEVDDNIIYIDAEVLDVEVRLQPIDHFLRTVRFAGDGLAISCQDDRPIVIPEYMSLPPVVAIYKTEETDDQNNVEWVNEHLQKLQQFQEKLFEAVNSKVDEPARS